MKHYLCSNSDLEEIAWDDKNPNFSISRANDSEVVERYVKERTGKTKIYEFISYQGCGCGFYVGEGLSKNIQGDEEELSKNISDIDKLFSYLRKMIKIDPSLKIYFCWDGEEYIETKQEDILHLNQDFHDSFELEQNFIYSVSE